MQMNDERLQESSLEQLHLLGRQANQFSSSHAVQTLKKFVDIYIHTHRQSEDYFIALCEHNIIPRLFSLGKSVSTLQVLEIFNLLMANTAKMSHLVFLFSQPTMHEFLFEHFHIDKEMVETVQYYVQLLKAMIMKMLAQGHGSLIKVFCNIRFPHFPLLTVVVGLGVDLGQEVLVRVTANQCVLLLIRLMNQTKVGLEYLSQLQLLVYYHELIVEMFGAEEGDQQQHVKLVVDLIFSLKNNIVGLSIFMNLFTNHLLFKHIGRLPRILQFLTFFYDQMAEHTIFPTELAEEIILILCRVVANFYAAPTVNYTYFTAQRILSKLVVPERPRLIKFYQQRCKKIVEYLIRPIPLPQDEKELEFVLEEWLHFNYKNKEISPLKEVKVRRRSAIGQFFTSQQEFMEEYIQALMTWAGISSDKIKNPIYKLSFTTDYQTALYLVEAVCLKFGESRLAHDRRAGDHFYRDQMWELFLSESLLTELYNISSRVSKVECEKQQKSQKKILIGKMQGFNYLLWFFKPQLVRRFCSVLASHQGRPEMHEMALISALSVKLNLGESLSSEYLQHLFGKLRDLQIYITQDVFSQQNFHFVFKYISKNKERTILKRVDRSKECESPVSSKKKFHKIRSRIEGNFIQYEVIKRLIDSSVKTLSEFIGDYWKARFYSEKNGVFYPVCQFLSRDSSGILLEVIADEGYQFAVKKSRKEGESVTYPIGRDDCSLDKENPTYLSFEDHKFLIDLETEERARGFREDLNRLRKERVELIMNGILEYLTFSFESLSAVKKIRSSKMKSICTPK